VGNAIRNHATAPEQQASLLIGSSGIVAAELPAVLPDQDKATLTRGLLPLLDLMLQAAAPAHLEEPVLPVLPAMTDEQMVEQVAFACAAALDAATAQGCLDADAASAAINSVCHFASRILLPPPHLPMGEDDLSASPALQMLRPKLRDLLLERVPLLHRLLHAPDQHSDGRSHAHGSSSSLVQVLCVLLAQVRRYVVRKVLTRQSV
jgi:hypothetical protein